MTAQGTASDQGTNARPAVSIVIPCYQCASTIGAVLEALLQQTVSPLEIIVVDDHSPDDLESALRPYRDRIIYIRHPRNQGLARTCNTGLERASAQFVMTLHSDCLPDPDYVEKLLAHLTSDPNIGAVTGQYLFEDVQQLALSDRMFVALNRIPAETDRSDQSVNTVNFIEGKADLFRRDVIAEYGFFNTNLVLTAEDQELSAKLRRDGYRLIQDCGCRFRVMFTATSGSMMKVLNKQRTYARGQVYIMLKFGRNALGETTPNRRSRARHRLGQLTWVSFMILFMAAALRQPVLLGGVALIWLYRMIHYYRIARPLAVRDRLLASVLGPVGDLLYFAGAVEGFVKTVLFRKT